MSQESTNSSPDRPVAREDASSSAATAAAFRELQQQNLAVLLAIEQLQEDHDTTLNHYTASISTQLNALTEAFVSQREQELQTMRNSNRFVLIVAASIATFAVIIMLVSALLPIWAMRRFGATGSGAQMGSLLLHGYTSGFTGFGVPLLTVPEGEQLGTKLGGAIEDLEHRLVALERRARSEAAAQGSDVKTPKLEAKVKAADAVDQRGQAEKGVAVAVKNGGGSGRAETTGAKYSKAARVAITLGEGEAIGFLPSDAALTKFHSFQAFLWKCKRVFGMAGMQRARHSGPTLESAALAKPKPGG